MGAEVGYWVEIVVPTKVWRRSYGVTSDDALESVELSPGEYPTGNVSREPPEDEE